MNKSFLATLNFDLNVENKEITVRELNYDKLSEGIDSIFEKVEIPVVITEPESIPPESESETITKIKKDFKEKLLSQYVTNNSLVFFISNKNDKMSDAIKDASNKINEIENKYKELSEEDFKEYIEGLDNGEEKAKEILDSLGLDENSTEDEIREAAEKAADELVSALEGKDSNNAAVNQILDNCDGGGSGLRHDIYNKIKSIADNGKDIDCILYSTGIAEVTAKYFTTGVMHIAVHVGGTAIFGVGTSIGLSAIQNLSAGMSTIQAGTKSINPIDQAQKLADGISNMYSQGTINSLVVGMMQGSTSPVPLVGNGTQTGIQHSSMKVMIMIAAIAGFTILAAGGMASMSAKTQKPWNAMLSALGAKDGNDLFAMLVAAGIKASLITTIAKTIETTAGSSGTGLLIPFGP